MRSEQEKELDNAVLKGWGEGLGFQYNLKFRGGFNQGNA